MPSEIRQLLFRSREIILAITEYFQRRGLALPSGTATRVVIADAQPTYAVLDIATDQGETVGVENQCRSAGGLPDPLLHQPEDPAAGRGR
ncbi:MAG: hypothetical protein WDN69_29765 [Aliidongia sp.]